MIVLIVLSVIALAYIIDLIARDKNIKANNDPIDARRREDYHDIYRAIRNTKSNAELDQLHKEVLQFRYKYGNDSDAEGLFRLIDISRIKINAAMKNFKINN